MNGKLVKIIRTVTSHLGEFPGFSSKKNPINNYLFQCWSKKLHRSKICSSGDEKSRV